MALSERNVVRSKRNIESIAGNGLIDRRMRLGGGMAVAGARGGGFATSATGAGAEPLADAPWSLAPGDPVPAYQVPSKFANNVVRTLANPNYEPRTIQSRTPHHLL